MSEVIDDYFKQQANIDAVVKANDYKRSFNLESINTPTTISIYKVKALIHQLNEEKELAYADFDEYKASVLGIEADELPDDEYRYGIERCLQLLNKLIAESEAEDGNDD